MDTMTTATDMNQSYLPAPPTQFPPVGAPKKNTARILRRRTGVKSLSAIRITYGGSGAIVTGYGKAFREVLILFSWILSAIRNGIWFAEPWARRSRFQCVSIWRRCFREKIWRRAVTV